MLLPPSAQLLRRPDWDPLVPAPRWPSVPRAPDRRLGMDHAILHTYTTVTELKGRFTAPCAPLEANRRLAGRPLGVIYLRRRLTTHRPYP